MTLELSHVDIEDVFLKSGYLASGRITLEELGAMADVAVIPLHTPKDGRCDCLAGRQCPHPGKHPRTANGLDDATRDKMIGLLKEVQQTHEEILIQRRGKNAAVLKAYEDVEDRKREADAADIIAAFKEIRETEAKYGTAEEIREMREEGRTR